MVIRSREQRNDVEPTTAGMITALFVWKKVDMTTLREWDYKSSVIVGDV